MMDTIVMKIKGLEAKKRQSLYDLGWIDALYWILEEVDFSEEEGEIDRGVYREVF